MARAYSMTLASVVAPFEYVALPINVLWGFVLWRELPTWTTWAGASLTLLSGLYMGASQIFASEVTVTGRQNDCVDGTPLRPVTVTFLPLFWDAPLYILYRERRERAGYGANPL